MLNEHSIATTTNIHRTQVQLDENLVFVPHMHHGRAYYHVESPNDSRFFRLGFAEYCFISLLDGQTTFAEALALSSRQLGREALSTPQAVELYLWLLENRLATLRSSPAASLRDQRHPSKQSPALPNPFWIRIPLGSPDRLVKWLLPSAGWLLNPIATGIGLLVILMATVVLGIHWQQFSLASKTIIAPGNLVWLSATWICLKLVHELAHALCCRYYAGEVKQCGIVLLLLAPLAYVDVTSSWRNESKWRRIHVAAAGMYAELLVASLAAFLWTQVHSPQLANLLYNVIFMASVSTALFNANPLMKFDGYFILSDLVGIPNLYTRGSQAVQQHCARLFFGQGFLARESGWERAWIVGYGWLALVWRVVVCATLLISAAAMFHGCGMLLVAVALLAWGFKKVAPTIALLQSRFQSDPASCMRAAILASALLAVGFSGWLYVPTPATVVAPAIMQYEVDGHVRTWSDGVVATLHVVDGQPVEAGQLLVTLSNPSLEAQRDDLEIAVAQADLKVQGARKQHDPSATQVAEAEMHALAIQLKQLVSRCEALLIYAPCAGQVVRRDLDQLVGTYLSAGDELLVIGNEREKELQLSIAQADFDAAVPLVGRPVKVRIGSQAAVTGILQRLEPRASTTLAHAALAATEGGPLAVVATEADEQAELELTEPRFNAFVQLAPEECATIACGRRGQVLLGNRRESLGQTCYRVIARWVKEKFAMATGEA